MFDILFEVCLRSRVKCSDHHFLLPSHKFKPVTTHLVTRVSRHQSSPFSRYELLFLWRACHFELGVKRWDLDLEARGV